jgi:DEAD/DEAH box helicase domain-containing protein
MNQPVVLDLETQHTFQEVGFDPRKLKISVVGIYNYATSDYQIFREHELNRLFPILEHAQTIIGFNIRKFDLAVLSPYYVGDIRQFHTLDLLEEVEKAMGFRVALDDVARATLGEKKNGHGFLAIDYFRNGEWEKLAKYCLHDVEITKKLYEFVQKEGYLYFLTAFGKKQIPITLSSQKRNDTSVSLSLPF